MAAPPGRLEDQVLAQVDALRDEMVAFAQELVRIPTLNPPGEGYLECARAIGVRLERLGYEVVYVPSQGLAEHTASHPRVNVLGRLPGSATRPLLHFNGHFDVVPTGGNWTVDPFGGLVRDGRLYGRGSSDQKAGIAASVYAVEAIRRAGVKLRGTVEQSGTVDEESGGFAGMAYLCDQGYLSRDRTDYVVITEPLNYDRICLGHRGVYWFEVRAHGQMAHGSMPHLGVNAADLMAEVICAINHELKPALRERVTDMPVEPPEARRASINLNALVSGQVDNGLQTPCVPDESRAVFDRRFLVEEDLRHVQREVRELLDGLAARVPNFKYSLRDLMVAEPTFTDQGCEVVQAVAGSIEQLLVRRPAFIASPGTYDQKHVVRRAGVKQCIAYGPGMLDLAHQPDEYVELDHLVASARILALSTLRLLGVH